MASSADHARIADQARRVFAEQLVRGLVTVVNALSEAAAKLLDQPTEHSRFMRRRELVHELKKGAAGWHKAMVNGLHDALLHGGPAQRSGNPATLGHSRHLTLVDDDTIEREIVTSRLGVAMAEEAAAEFTDLRARIAALERRAELEPDDVLRPEVLARIVVDAWRGAGCSLDGWRELQAALHGAFAALVLEAYHGANRWLVDQGVLVDVDLHAFIRKSRNVPMGAVSGYGGPSVTGSSVVGGVGPGVGPSTFGGTASAADRGAVAEETRLMTQAAPLARAADPGGEVLGRLNRLVARQVRGFADTTRAQALSPALAQAIAQQEQGLRRRADAAVARGPATVTTPALLADLQQRKQSLKQAAATPEERATIEIVALMFQSILTEERIPAAVRVWFARLQMPVLRVAVTEPDFFATVDHPARRLIDRMGACVLGFDNSTRTVGDALEKEIKRVVQVVEAYPDTGRRVFQTVLAEFERFLEHYFSTENEATRLGVSLAQQVEQRETLAVQYTIELRRMLEQVPVQDSVRAFLFQVWADVLATTAVRYGAHSDEIRTAKRAASDLIWSASAKVTREERAEVIRRLTPLLKTLRDGMSATGMDPARQDEHLQVLNNSLAAAFTAKAPVIPSDRLKELAERLESLEELLPDAAEAAIDDSIVRDLSGHESSELEVVAEGGSMPTPAMLAWARELQVGGWYMLDYRGRNEPVQLAWLGLQKKLSMFVTPQGRCVLFQQPRLASFLQAGLLLPAQDESLSVRATRNALAKLDVDPQRLLA
jgi:hypothetical protein